MSMEPKWPKRPVFPPEFNANSDQYRAAQLDYQSARAEAALVRLRVAVEALNRISMRNVGQTWTNNYIEAADEALAAIDLPEE